jgi:hypothetical protein
MTVAHSEPVPAQPVPDATATVENEHSLERVRAIDSLLSLSCEAAPAFLGAARQGGARHYWV